MCFLHGTIDSVFHPQPPPTKMVDMECSAKVLDHVCSASGISLASIEKAAARISPYANYTDLVNNEHISSWANEGSATKTEYMFKLESLQKTGSFKFRGAVNALAAAAEGSDAPKTAVVTHSSGNHGAAIAAAAATFGRESFVVMANTAPQWKQELVGKHGAKVVLCEPSMSSRKNVAESVAEANGAVLLQSSLDKDVVSGQGTVGLEIMKQMPDVDAIVASIGTGGLIGSIAVAAKSIRRDVKIIGVEPDKCNSAALSLKQGERVETPYDVDTIADGLKVSIGPISWTIVQHLIDDVIVVTEDEIKEGVKVMVEGLNASVEGSAGATVAATRTEQFRKWGFRKVAVVVCGGNCAREI